MGNIVHCRVDDRLIHGQVATSWLPHTKANLCLIANDELANDPTRQTLISMAAPAGIAVRFFSVEKTIAIIGKASLQQKIFILLENITDAARLVNGGFPLKEINLGNVGAKTNTRQIKRTIHLTHDEQQQLENIAAKGVGIYYQLLPADSTESLGEKV